MRGVLGFLLLALSCASAATHPGSEVITGKLVLVAGKPPAIETADHNFIQLDGDKETRQILADLRLNGYEVQAKGRTTFPGKFFLDPFHTTSLMVRQNGKLMRITYWCKTCHLRAYTPGPCVCCQAETDLDLIDPDAP